MLKEPLFTIHQTDHQENIIRAGLSIHQNNEIFDGHFPGQPVVPGASMLQVVKEVLEKNLNQSLRLLKADNIKFLSLVEPGTIDALQLELNYKLIEYQININATLTAGEVVCMKLQGTFIPKI